MEDRTLLAIRMIGLAIVAGTINGLFWVTTQGPALHGGAATLGMTYFAAIFRFAIDLTLFLFISLPMSARISDPRSWLSLPIQIAAAAIGGTAPFALAHLFGHMEGVSFLWIAASFAISGLLWSMCDMAWPLPRAGDGARTAINQGVVALHPIVGSVDRAAPWLAAGYLAPFLFVGTLFLLYVLFS